MFLISRKPITQSFRHKYVIKKWRPIIINADKCIQVGLECERCGKRILRLLERNKEFEEEYANLMDTYCWDIDWIRKKQYKCKANK